LEQVKVWSGRLAFVQTYLSVSRPGERPCLVSKTDGGQSRPQDPARSSRFCGRDFGNDQRDRNHGQTGAYYIGHFDGSGRPLTVEKRKAGKTGYKYNYTYENGRLAQYVYIDQDEKLLCAQRAPTGDVVPHLIALTYCVCKKS
jgi:hypothetical protein